MAAATEKELVFIDWLKRHGAVLDKLEWPAVDPATGSRGAITRENIESGDVVLEIPGELMMTPVAAFSDPLVGEVLLSHRDMVRGDLLLTVYIMHERRKGEDSFYFPYLNILPDLNNLSEWKDEELAQLQDEKLIARAGSTRRLLKISYAKSIVKLSDMYPDLFPPEQFSFDNFVFAWYTIQARAFGRRLPWTALVPFADCLNHKNVQTKYDYKPVEESNEKQFRLFLSGRNRYAKGSEAFNSYGKRPNDNLLLEYGFAMLDNEWDELPLLLSLNRHLGLYEDKVELVCSMKRMISKTYYVHTREFHPEALHFLRLCVCETMEELELFRSKGWYYGESYGPISLANEVKALKYFAASVQDLLINSLSAGTTIEEDIQILKSIDEPAGADAVDTTGAEGVAARFYRENRLRPALYYRMTRKRIAMEIIRRTETFVDILSSIPSEAVQGEAGNITRISVADVDSSLLEKISSALATEDRKSTSTGSDIYQFKPFEDNTINAQRCDPYFREVIAGFIDFGEPPSSSEGEEGGIVFAK